MVAIGVPHQQSSPEGEAANHLLYERVRELLVHPAIGGVTDDQVPVLVLQTLHRTDPFEYYHWLAACAISLASKHDGTAHFVVSSASNCHLTAASGFQGPVSHVFEPDRSPIAANNGTHVVLFGSPKSANVDEETYNFFCVMERRILGYSSTCSDGNVIPFTESRTPANTRGEIHASKLLWLLSSSFSKQTACFSLEHFVRHMKPLLAKLLHVLNQLLRPAPSKRYRFPGAVISSSLLF